MKIDLFILLPGAAIAVLILILFIRLMTGRRDIALDPDTCTSLLAATEPELSLEKLTISDDKTCALGKAKDQNLFLLFRRFGNKPVVQILSDLKLIQLHKNSIRIGRQDIGHPPVHLKTNDPLEIEFWTRIKREGIP